MGKEDTPKKPLWKRLLRSILRIFTLLFLILFFCGGGFYCWNPQKVHYPPKKPVGVPKVFTGNVGILFSKDARVTVVVGHPDDAEYFISGMLLKLHDAGTEITLIVVTDGDKSYYPPFFTDVEENRKTRRQEQTEASSYYGARVVFLGGPDGRYDPDEPNLRKKLENAMVESRPDEILTFDPEYLPIVQHRDHENAGRAASELAYKTSAKTIFFFASTAPNFCVATGDYWSQRSDLIAIHKSQFSGQKLERVRATLMERELNDGEKFGGDMGEAFRAMKLKD